MSTKYLASLVLVAIPFASSAMAQGVPGNEGKWKINDGGSAQLVTGLTAPKTYRVRNQGTDSSVVVTVFNAQGAKVSSTPVPGGQDRDIGVPQGGSMRISDPTDDDAFGAAGTYKVVP